MQSHYSFMCSCFSVILISWLELQIECARALSSRKKEAKLRGWDAIRLSDGSKEILFVCTRDNYAINHFLITISLSVSFQIFNFQLTWAASRKTTRFCRRISYSRSTDDSWFSIDRLQCVLMDNTIGILMYVVLMYIYFPLFTVFHSASFTPISLDLTQNFIHPKPRELRYSHVLISIFLTPLCQRRDTRFSTALYAHESPSQSSTREITHESRKDSFTRLNSILELFGVRWDIDCVCLIGQCIEEKSSDDCLIKQCWLRMGMEERLWTIETKENRSHDWWLQFMLSSMSFQASISIIYCMLSLFDVGWGEYDNDHYKAIARIE